MVESGLTKYDAETLRDMANHSLISVHHPSFGVLEKDGLIERGVATETTPWLDDWYVISDKGRAAAKAQ